MTKAVPRYAITEAERILLRAAREAGTKKTFAPHATGAALLAAFRELAISVGFAIRPSDGGYWVRPSETGGGVQVTFTEESEIIVSGGEPGAFERVKVLYNPRTDMFEDATEPAAGQEPRSALAVLAEVVARRLAT